MEIAELEAKMESQISQMEMDKLERIELNNRLYEETVKLRAELTSNEIRN